MNTYEKLVVYGRYQTRKSSLVKYPTHPSGPLLAFREKSAPRDVWDISLGMISSFDIVKISLGRCPRDILLIYLSSPHIPLGFASWYMGWLEVYQAIYYSFFISPRGILYSIPVYGLLRHISQMVKASLKKFSDILNLPIPVPLSLFGARSHA